MFFLERNPPQPLHWRGLMVFFIIEIFNETALDITRKMLVFSHLFDIPGSQFV